MTKSRFARHINDCTRLVYVCVCCGFNDFYSIYTNTSNDIVKLILIYYIFSNYVWNCITKNKCFFIIIRTATGIASF